MKPAAPPLYLSPRDEDILRSVYTFRYMTAKDIAFLWFTPKVLNYVRQRLARLSGGVDLATHTYTSAAFNCPALGSASLPWAPRAGIT